MNHVVVFWGPVLSKMAPSFLESLLSKDEVEQVTIITLSEKVRVPSEIKKYANVIHLLSTEEMKGALPQIELTEIERLKEEYGPGISGRLMASDRRLSRGLFWHTKIRPSELDSFVSSRAMFSENFALGALLASERVLERLNPDQVFFYAVAGVESLSLLLSAQKLGIPYMIWKHSRIEDFYSLSDDLFGPGSEYERTLERIRNSGLSELHSAEARRAIAYFRASEDGIYKGGSTGKSFSELVDLTIVLANFAVGKSSFLGVKRSIFNLRAVFIAPLSRRLVQSLSKKEPEKFVFFPLHVDPEASTMVLAPYAGNQFDLIERLARSLPPGTTLVVKEHTPMFGFRKREFYRKVSRVPKVQWASPKLKTKTLIKNSSLLFTVTGTASLEAAVLGTPSITAARSIYGKVNGMAELDWGSDWAEQIDNHMDEPAPAEADVEMVIASVIAQSFRIEKDIIFSAASIDDETVDRLSKLLSQSVATAIGRGSLAVRKHKSTQ